MLVPKSGRWTVPEPPPLGMERVSELKILGVLFTISVTSHVDDIISKMRLLYVCAPHPEGKRVAGQCTPSQHWNLSPFITRMGV